MSCVRFCMCYNYFMIKVLILNTFLFLAIAVLITLVMTTLGSRPSQAEEDRVQKPCVPMQADQPISAGGGAEGAEIRTPEDMERANREVPEFAGQVPPSPGPTEENYWQKKAEADAMREKATAQDKASALEEEKKAEREKYRRPCAKAGSGKRAPNHSLNISP